MANELDIKGLLDSNRSDIIQRLPSYLSPTQFFSLAYGLERAKQTNPKLYAAVQHNPNGLIAAVLRVADLGLLIGSAYEHCDLIAYGDDIQVSVRYHGLVYQLVRAGAVLKVNAACAYEGDLFKVELGDEERIVHEPNLHNENRRKKEWLYDKKNILGAYAVAWLPDPLRRLKQHRWCDLGEIEAARDRSPNKDGPAWRNNYPAMAIKTAIRRLCKLIEVCGPTDENKEAWERFGRTIELEKSSYHETDEDEQDPDMPGERPAKPPSVDKPSAVSGRRVEASGGKNTPPPQNGGARKAAAPPPPPVDEEARPPQEPPTDEPISEDMQNKLFDLMKLSGMRPVAFFKHVKDTYGVATLEALKSSQGAELEKYLKSAS